jgi:glycosyltransferase involved in cell wall biosynthesis
MRILFDARRSVHRATGIGRVIDGLLGALAADDGGHEYLVLYGEKNPLEGAAAPRFELLHSDLGLNSPQANLTFPRLAREWAADVAYFPFWLMPLAMPCPSVVAIHDLIYSNFPAHLPPTRRLVYRTYTLLSARAARRIHTLAEHGRRDLYRFFRVPPAKVDVIAPDVGPEFLPRPVQAADIELLRTLGLGRPFALYVGNHKPHKNLERLLRAYALVAGQIGVDLAIVGAQASYEDPFALPYVDLMRQIVGEGRVRFLGQVDDAILGRLYNAASFVVFPSLYEGFGLSPLEAMRSGAPVACSNTTSLPEVVGDAALTFDPTSERQIAGALLTLDQSPGLREALARRGLERARLFSWRQSAQRWRASLERAAG